MTLWTFTLAIGLPVFFALFYFATTPFDRKYGLLGKPIPQGDSLNPFKVETY